MKTLKITTIVSVFALLLTPVHQAFSQQQTKPITATTESSYAGPQVSSVLDMYVENEGNNFGEDDIKDGMKIYNELSLKLKFQNNWSLTPVATFNLQNNTDGKDYMQGDNHYITLKKSKILNEEDHGISFSAYVRQFGGITNKTIDTTPSTRLSGSISKKLNSQWELGNTLQTQYYWDRPEDRSVRYRNRDIVSVEFAPTDKISFALAGWWINYFKETDNNDTEYLINPSVNLDLTSSISLSPYIFLDGLQPSQKTNTYGLNISAKLL